MAARHSVVTPLGLLVLEAAIATREGLVVVSDLGPAELTARYLIGTDGLPDGMMAEFPRILHARVP